MTVAETIEAKNIFIDIVDYTINRSVEAQTNIIYIINQIVKNAVAELEILPDEIIYIPTGDGMCITIVNRIKPFDIHLQLAINILGKLYDYNISCNDNMRRFDIRIGINENVDNLITDINNQKNVSGSGINIASRIMDFCDGNQIIVGQSVFEKISQREKYMKSFIPYKAVIKHDVRLTIYQYVDKNISFLNCETPSAFEIKSTPVKKLTNLQGYYILTCIEYNKFIIDNSEVGQSTFSLHVAMFHLAEDRIADSNKKITQGYSIKKIKTTLDEYVKKLNDYMFYVVADLKDLITREYLNDIAFCFSEPFLIVNDIGKQKFINEFPDLYRMSLIN